MSTKPRLFGLEDARIHLKDLCAAAARGEEVVITRRGRPIARVVGVEQVSTTVVPAPSTWSAVLFGEPVAVTKPGADLPQERARLYEQAVRDGWVDLEWSPESHPGRLYGRRPSKRVARAPSEPRGEQ